MLKFLNLGNKLHVFESIVMFDIFKLFPSFKHFNMFYTVCTVHLIEINLYNQFL